MKPSVRHAAGELKAIRREGLYRKMISATPAGAYVKVGRKRLLNLSSNDYLGLRGPRTLRAGQSASSSRLLSGNAPGYTRVESTLAAHARQGGALVLPTGYMANMGALSALAKKGDLIVSDAQNHASIIDACRMCGAKVAIYAHNDIKNLNSKLAIRARKKFVITEGVFSMDGDVADLDGITEVARRHGATTILDDAHGDFVLGEGGRGTSHMQGSKGKVDIHTSSLSKALGSFGGYIAADSQVIDLCINRARALIYTSALPGFVIDHITQKLRAPKASQRKRLAQNTRQLHNMLDSLGLGIDGIRTHIAPVIVHDERRALELGALLYEYGVLAQAIRYPTVRRGEARIRISVTAWPTHDEMGRGLDMLARACRKLGVA